MLEKRKVDQFGDFLEVEKNFQAVVGYSHYLYLELREKAQGSAPTTQAIFANGNITDTENGEVLPDSMFIFNDKIKKFLTEKR